MEQTVGRPSRSPENARRGAAGAGGDKPLPYGLAQTLARFPPPDTPAASVTGRDKPVPYDGQNIA